MKNLFFINEFTTENGRILLGRDTGNGILYHLEPLTIRRGGCTLQALRNGIGERRITGEPESSTGILPVDGPFYHQQETFIGWKKRNGQSIWADFANGRCSSRENEALVQLIRDMMPVIASYQLYHRTGLAVGAPVWERICRDAQGIFFPDPAFLSLVNKVKIELPLGLAHCRPPESFKGNPPGMAGDIFYLGVLIYVLLAGEIPYPLIHGWPTQAIVAGEFASLRIPRPDLSRSVTDLIDRMLNQYADCRPTADELADEWLKWDKYQSVCSTQEEYRRNTREKKVYHCRCWFKKILGNCFNWRTPVFPTITLLLILALLWLWSMNQLSISPMEFTKQFYQGTSNPAAVISHDKVRMLPDIVKERETRLKVIQNILGKPLLDLEGVRIVRKTGSTVILAVKVRYWRWTGLGWDGVDRREQLKIFKQGGHWEIVKRIELNAE